MSNETLSTATSAVITSTTLLAENGEATDPSITFTNDTNNGLFWSTVNKVSASVGGTAAINWKDDMVDMMLPINFNDVTAPAAPSGATNGYLYKKTGSDLLYWKTLGAGEFNLITTNTSEIKDSEFKVFDETNTSRKVRFELSSLTADSDHVWVMPSNSGTMTLLPNSSSLATINYDTTKATLGVDNTFYGYMALNSSATSGVGNTCFGYDATATITTGDYNTMLGNDTSNTTTADHCVYVGYRTQGDASAGNENVALGTSAMRLATGSYNTAAGYRAHYRKTGTYSVSIGHDATNTSYADTCDGMVAIGNQSTQNISSGDYNTIIGASTAPTLTTGANNIIIGALCDITTSGGSNNIIIGYNVDSSTSNRIRIGHATNNTSNYQAGIRGVTTANADAIAVLIDSAGQLGTVSSSRRYKENIESLDNVDNLYNLAPVSFNYKTDKSKKKVYGLIAEEVEEVLPDIVVYKEIDDGNGENERVPDTVQYHLLTPLLLSILKSQKEKIDELEEYLNNASS